MSGEGFGRPSRDDEDFGFLDEVVGGDEAATADAVRGDAGHGTPDVLGEGREGHATGRRMVRTRNRARKSRRYNKQDYVQISGVVSREVKARFDVALAREKAATGTGRKQFEVLESLMRFYAEEGDPYALLEEE